MLKLHRTCAYKIPVTSGVDNTEGGGMGTAQYVHSEYAHYGHMMIPKFGDLLKLVKPCCKII